MSNKLKAVGIFLAVLAIVGFVFTGCKGKDENTLSVFFYLEATAPNAISDANKWFDTFQKDNPGIKIERENLFDEPFHDKLRAYAAAGTLPDVMYVWPSGRSDYLHDQHLLKDLGPFLTKDNLRGFYIPLTMDPSQQQAGYMAMIPQSITTTHAFFTNMEVLNDCGLQPARNYEELKAQVPVLRAKGYDCIMTPAQSPWVMQSCLFSMVVGRFCGEGWEKKIHSGQAKFTDPDFVAALNFIKRLYDDGVIPRSAIGMDYGEGPGYFASNKCAYYIDGDWRLSAFITDKDTGEALISPSRQNNIRVGVFPDIEGAKLNSSSSVILGVGYAMAASIPAGSAKEDAAWKLIKWMTGKEVSTDRTVGGGTPTPSRTDLDFAAMPLEPMQKAVGALGDQFKTATVVIDGVLPSEVYLPINDGLIEIAMNAKTPVQVAAEVQRAADAFGIGK